MKMKFTWKVLLRERHVLKAIDVSVKLLYHFTLLEMTHRTENSSCMGP